jgi:tRNA-2-methylthio-N6-dimethylallyladenosine synthase
VPKKKVIDTSMDAFDKFDSLPMPYMGKVSSYISIMEGCNKFCTYCIVPFTRGEEISRSFKQIVKEAVTLCKLGTKELILLGQNVNGYHVKENNESIEFSKLTNYLSLIKGIERIRFTTSHPKHFLNNEIDLMFNSEKMAKHVHLPLQSGSNNTLKSMKRGYTIEQYRRIVEKINKKDPNISLTSDFIVGFPGETDADFDETFAAIEEFKFDQSFFFAYSPRPGTSSYLINDSVPRDLKQKRLKMLLDLNKKHITEHNLKLLGKEELVIVEAQSKKNPKELFGRTSSNKIINFPGKISNIGKLVNVKINQLKTHTLSGFILGE